MEAQARKGIILAGGSGTRLRPLTTGISKQILPVYDKPMIYYPLAVLMLANIREILVISTRRDIAGFRRLLGNGSQWGLSISYGVQTQPRGLADAFRVGRQFLGDAPAALVLGDNLFFGHGLSELLERAMQSQSNAVLFAYRVSDPQRYGVVEFADDGSVKSVEEKPKAPKSDWALTGLYFYSNDVVEVARTIKPSDRGELEITDVNKHYLEQGQLEVLKMGRGYTWLDTGNCDALLEAGEFVRVMEHRQGLKIACLEEIAFSKGWITAEQVEAIAKTMLSTTYGRYLLRLIESG